MALNTIRQGPERTRTTLWFWMAFIWATFNSQASGAGAATWARGAWVAGASEPGDGGLDGDGLVPVVGVLRACLTVLRVLE